MAAAGGLVPELQMIVCVQLLPYWQSMQAKAGRGTLMGTQPAALLLLS